MKKIKSLYNVFYYLCGNAKDKRLEVVKAKSINDAAKKFYNSSWNREHAYIYKIQQVKVITQDDNTTNN